MAVIISIIRHGPMTNHPAAACRKCFQLRSGGNFSPQAARPVSFFLGARSFFGTYCGVCVFPRWPQGTGVFGEKQGTWLESRRSASCFICFQSKDYERFMRRFFRTHLLFDKYRRERQLLAYVIVNLFVLYFDNYSVISNDVLYWTLRGKNWFYLKSSRRNEISLWN